MRGAKNGKKHREIFALAFEKRGNPKSATIVPTFEFFFYWEKGKSKTYQEYLVFTEFESNQNEYLSTLLKSGTPKGPLHALHSSGRRRAIGGAYDTHWVSLAPRCYLGAREISEVRRCIYPRKRKGHKGPRLARGLRFGSC